MNTSNYASLKASKRLVEAGIVLETEVVWYVGGVYVEPTLTRRKDAVVWGGKFTPAPSMAEVWRELPNGTWINTGCQGNETWNDNPTDALIDLLILIDKKG
jgi:hypothetical protein